jgi:hypothetical protein
MTSSMTSFLSVSVVYIVLTMLSPGKSGFVVGAGVGVGEGVVGAGVVDVVAAGGLEGEYEFEAAAKIPPAMFVEAPAE